LRQAVEKPLPDEEERLDRGGVPLQLFAFLEQ